MVPIFHMQAQGLDMESARVHQDNNSAILLEVNGRMSSSKQTKHIKSKYFFIKDKVDQGEIEIRKKDTNDMWCDVCTKLKQGSPFRKDRAMIMNCPMEATLPITEAINCRSVLEITCRFQLWTVAASAA